MIDGFEQIQFFEQILFETLGYDLSIESFEFVSGGCINNAVRLQTPEGVFFVKWNVQSLEGMFEAEAKGLALIAAAQEIDTPKVMGWGTKGDTSYLMLEFVQTSFPKQDFWKNFGAKLARLHQHQEGYFGLAFDNYIGSLPQYNQIYQEGLPFFIEKRLKIQAGLALYHQQISKELYQKLELLYQKLPNLLPNEAPALLHGDLWSGNYMITDEGQPLLIDPAVYYGFREAELAFTRLFGGFEEDFYTAYQEEFPLEKGFQERLDIYNLYPLLVHVNLFGSGYLNGVRRTLEKYVG